jgi:hypothetical protein
MLFQVLFPAQCPEKQDWYFADLRRGFPGNAETGHSGGHIQKVHV